MLNLFGTRSSEPRKPNDVVLSDIKNMIKPGSVVKSLGYGANLSYAIKSGNEIMIHGNYYLINGSFEHYVVNKLFR